MAKQNLTLNFKNAQISIDEDKIYEFTKDDVKVYSLSEEFSKFIGEGRFVDITLKEAVEVEPKEDEE